MSSLDWALWRVRVFATSKSGPMAATLQEQGIALARTSHSQAWLDMKSRWRRGLLWILYPSILIGLIFCLRYSIIAPYQTDYNGGACLPDGTFSLKHDTYNYWAASGFFQITLGFGSLSFAEAKIIDVAWDVVIGRGGQAILALLSWNVFADYVTATMQIAPVTFKTFRTLFVQRDISTLLGITRLAKGFTRLPHKLPSKSAMVFMITTMAFILAFPTFGSAMTGYSANVLSFVEDQSGNYAPLNNYKRLYYTIEDGKRIGMSDGYQVTSTASYFSYESYCYFSNATRSYDAECEMLDYVTRYIVDYGIEGATNNSTTFGQSNETIPAPSLNIKVHFLQTGYLSMLTYYYDRPGLTSGTYLVRTPGGGELNLAEKNTPIWTNGGNYTYDQSYMQDNGKCQPTVTYQWGFSYIQLILIIFFLMIWDIGLFALYISAQVSMRRNGHVAKAPGDFQADVQLVRALETQTCGSSETVEEKEVAGLSAKELKKRIDKDLNGGSISNKDSLLRASDVDAEGPTWQLRKWMKGEALWLLMLIIAVFGCLLAVWQRPSFVLAHFAPLLVILTMYVGQSWKSRVVLLVWSVLVVLIVSIPVWAGKQDSRH